jgi:hypothetical protein
MEVEAPKHEGVVRGTIQKVNGVVLGLYNRAEQYPVFRSTFGLYKPLAPVVQRVVAVADPWVDSVDNVMAETWKTVNNKVIDPARKKSPSGEVSFVGVYAEVREVATIELKNRYTALLDVSDHVVDTWLPEAESDFSADKNEKKEEKHTKSIGEVTTKAQKRLFKRFEHKWQDVRVFSAGRLQEIIHVDLAEYAENGFKLTVSFTNDRVVPVINNLTTGGLALVTDAQNSFSTARTLSAEKSKLLWDAIARYRELSYQKYLATWKYAAEKSEHYGFPTLVGKAKEVSLGEVSEFVLVKLNIKQQNEQFVVVERKVFDLLRTLVGLIIVKDRNQSGKGSQSQPADDSAPAQASQ